LEKMKKGYAVQSVLDTDDSLLPGCKDRSVSWLHLACPCDVLDHKRGVSVAGSGKPAQTAFAVVAYDAKTDSTVVLAKPVTGWVYDFPVDDHVLLFNASSI